MRARLVGPALAGPVLAVLAGIAAAAGECAAPPGFVPRERLEAAGIVLLYRTVPAAIELGRHFAVEAVVCDGRPGVAPHGLRVDARMPEHRHGMNYRPRVSSTLGRPLGRRGAAVPHARTVAAALRRGGGRPQRAAGHRHTAMPPGVPDRCDP